MEMKVGDLVHFVDDNKIDYESLGMVIGRRFTDASWRSRVEFKVTWYDTQIAHEFYQDAELVLISKAWRFN